MRTRFCWNVGQKKRKKKQKKSTNKTKKSKLYIFFLHFFFTFFFYYFFLHFFFHLKKKKKNVEEISEELKKKAEEHLSVNYKVSDYLLGGSISSQTFLPNKNPKRIIQAHKGEVNCVTYNLSGTRFATSSNDKYIKLWDSPSGSQIGFFLHFFLFI